MGGNGGLRWRVARLRGFEQDPGQRNRRHRAQNHHGNAAAEAAAQDYCKQYGRVARITAQGNDAGGTTVFVCLAPGKQSPFER